ncbi:hypothetical protein IKP85_06315 [bacterium]|nr:hypothetical protein [bacterium]
MKKMLLIVGILAFALPAIASVGTKESTSIQYLRNYGYSESGNRYVQTLKATNNGEPYYNSYEFNECSKYYGRNKIRNGIVSFTRSFFNYIDPSEDACKFWNKDIKYYANTQDY